MNPWLSDDGRLRPVWRFLLGALAAFVANFLAIGIAESASHGRGRLLEAIYRPTTLLLLLAAFALLLIAVDQVHEGLPRAMGLGRFSGWLRQAGLGMAIGTASVCVAVAWIAAAGDLAVKVGFGAHTLTLALAVLFTLATGAMAEETMFRGYPFHRLLEAAPAPVAVVIMSALFAAAHGGNPHASKLAMVNTFAISVLLCVAYLRTRALWLPWGIHFAWNAALGTVFGLPVSGLTEFAVIVRTQARGPRWVTGGAYGIEGSVVGTIVILLAFAPLLLLTRKYQMENPHSVSPPRCASGQAPPGETRVGQPQV
ncbi:MAG: CPBP family intramembrane metalloprotease [Acidobacteriia bacterium]|nr:CPBP family intramembrane metalloprotease [Terriglobia bacterium]